MALRILPRKHSRHAFHCRMVQRREIALLSKFIQFPQLEIHNRSTCVLTSPVRFGIEHKILNLNYLRQSSEIQDVHGALQKFFGITNLGFRYKFSNTDPGHDLFASHTASVCFTYVRFLVTLTKSSLLSDHISYIRRMDKHTRRLLKGTILVSEVSAAYCHIVYAERILYKDGRCDRDALHNVQFGSEILVSHLNW